MSLKLLSSILLVSLFSCNGNINLDVEPEVISPKLIIIQEDATPVDNIDVSLEPLVLGSSVVQANVYSKSVYTLSKHSGSVSVTIEGKYNDSLSAQDITDLDSIGLVNPDGASSKGNITGLSKNLAADSDLSYNIKIQASLYSDAGLTNKLISSKPSYIYVSGDNHYDGEFLTPVPDENYYLFHEWDTTQLSVVEKLPEGNYRKIAAGTTPTNRFDSMEFDVSLPKVNGYSVGYALSRTGSAAYKVTNDGSGITGWQFTSMASNFGTWGYVIPGLGITNGESDTFIQGRGFSSYANSAFNVSTWSGGSWIANNFGDSMKVALGGTWVNANSYLSRPHQSSDGSIWITILEGNSTAGSDAFQTIDYKASYLIRIKYNSGAYSDPASWSKMMIPFYGMDANFKSRINGVYVTDYTDDNNFSAYISGDGIGKIVRKNGIVSYTPIAALGDSSIYDASSDFPTGFDPNGLREVQNSLDIEQELSNSNFLIFQAYTSMFKLDIRNNKITEILGKKDGTTIEYSR